MHTEHTDMKRVFHFLFHTKTVDAIQVFSFHIFTKRLKKLNETIQILKACEQQIELKPTS